MSVTAEAFASLSIPVRRVIVVENEITFLSLDLPESTLAVFGKGYGFAGWQQAEWLHGVDLVYWGDLDTHGFAILNQFRSHFPRVRSLCMDEKTLMANRDFWSREPSPARVPLPRLHPEEQAVYQALCEDKLGQSVRLEQERIPLPDLARSWPV